MEPHSQVITCRPPRALRGDALRAALAPLGFVADDRVREIAPVPAAPPFVDIDPGPPPSTDAPRALTGDELRRALEALRPPE